MGFRARPDRRGNVFFSARFCKINEVNIVKRKEIFKPPDGCKFSDWLVVSALKTKNANFKL